MNLSPNLTATSRVVEMGPGAWRLELPAGPSGRYRLAQLDDYSGLRRGSFPWQPPLSLALRARASAPAIPGTWGFGLWNDPFGMGLLSGAGPLRLPTLPDTAWFFFASPPNSLSLQDDLPAQGWLATTFRSVRLSILARAFGVLGLPLLMIPPARRWLRRMGQRLVRQDAVALPFDPTAWHAYRLDWLPDQARFYVDGSVALATQVSPAPPLGLVLWIDNQYAAFPASGRMGWGTLPNPQPAWIEIAGLDVSNSFAIRGDH